MTDQKKQTFKALLDTLYSEIDTVASALSDVMEAFEKVEEFVEQYNLFEDAETPQTPWYEQSRTRWIAEA